MPGGSAGGAGGGFDYVQDAEPANAEEGEEWYDTGADKAYVFDGAAWVEQTVVDHSQLSGIGTTDHRTDSNVQNAVDGSTLSDLALSTSLTDPAGVQHTSELAEKTDVVEGVLKHDKAAAFDGSDGETVSQTDTKVKNKSVYIAGTEASISAGSYSNLSTADWPNGWKINPNDEITELEVTMDTDCTATELYLDTDSGTVTKSGLSGGDTVTFSNPDLSVGTKYKLEADANGNGYDYPSDAGNSFPITSEAFDVPAGSYNGSDQSYLANIQKVRSVGKSSGSVTVEWPSVDSADWITATFQRTLDNETVDVYAAYSNDGGSSWTRLNGGSPISRNFDLLSEQSNVSGFNGDSLVRLEAELSRSSLSNNPSLDLVSREYRL